MSFSPRRVWIAAFGIAASLSLKAANPQAVSQLLRGSEAFADYHSDAPGVRRLITTNDIPAPNTMKSADKHARIVPRPPNAWPKVPAGFAVALIASNLNNPRKIAAAPNGDIFVAESGPGRVTVLRETPKSESAGPDQVSRSVFAQKLRQPFGIAFYPPGPEPKYVYVANTDSVIRHPYQNGDLQARGPEEMIVPDIPGGGKLGGGGHWTRDIVFSLDGKRMFVSVGSHSNNNDDENEKHRADILEFNPDGSGLRVYATGIRNAVGIAIEPRSGKLWGSVNERDGLGDDVPPDYITHIEESGFYGWPWFYIGAHYDPKFEGKHRELRGNVIVPDVLIQAHSASLCMTFYTATNFPSRYHGWAFAAEHGSWNRATRTGYKVICIPIKDGSATGEYEDFMTGFVTESGDVWGRPVGVTVDAQGALLVSDDAGNCIWRVHYK